MFAHLAQAECLKAVSFNQTSNEIQIIGDIDTKMQVQVEFDGLDWTNKCSSDNTDIVKCRYPLSDNPNSKQPGNSLSTQELLVEIILSDTTLTLRIVDEYNNERLVDGSAPLPNHLSSFAVYEDGTAQIAGIRAEMLHNKYDENMRHEVRKIETQTNISILAFCNE